jgi:4-amino-4-deoxy-L-arabinose transferase-like glycosyltransferase
MGMEKAGFPPFVYAAAAVHFVLHLVTNGRYGVFRDEFYYLACADHLDWGYVDHPPLSIVLLWAQRALLGESVWAIRLLPALAGVAVILLAARLARELGGGRFAEGLAALAVAIVPQYLVITGFYSMNAFDVLFWAGAALVVARIVNTGDTRLWLVLGALLGLGLQNKISVLFFGFGLAVALVLTPLRSHLLRPQLWLGGLLAAALFLPHLLWQVAHDWPTLEFIRNAKLYKITPFSPLQFFGAQFGEIHPWNAPLWLGGLLWLLAGREGRKFRVFGIVYVVAFVTMSLQNSKPYYLGPAYPMLLAAGAVAFEGLSRTRTYLRPVLVCVLVVGGLLIAPLVVPLLPVERLIAYQRALGAAPVAAERTDMGPLQQHFADRFGWEEMTAAVAKVYQGLPENEKAAALIVTSNYGEAGALRYFGPRHGLPAAVSQHNNYFLWGPGQTHADVVITVGMDVEDVTDTFESVTVAGRLESPYAMPFETRSPILVCRGLKIPLAEAWARGKKFI